MEGKMDNEDRFKKAADFLKKQRDAGATGFVCMGVKAPELGERADIRLFHSGIWSSDLVKILYRMADQLVIDILLRSTSPKSAEALLRDPGTRIEANLRHPTEALLEGLLSTKKDPPPK